jgi:phytoene dehydrogenase-like protein
LATHPHIDFLGCRSIGRGLCASRADQLPLRSPRDLYRQPVNFLLIIGRWRYLTWSVADALRASSLAQDKPLCGLLSMLLQDTVHALLEDAPLINGALGTTIRGAGLTRPRGGMRGFWRALLARYRALGGNVRTGTHVDQIMRIDNGYHILTSRGEFRARQVISTLPIWNTARLGLPEVTEALSPFLHRDDVIR